MYLKSYIRGFHVYHKKWEPDVGEVVACRHEINNAIDLHAVTVLKDGSTVVGHVPMAFSKHSVFFLKRGCL